MDWMDAFGDFDKKFMISDDKSSLVAEILENEDPHYTIEVTVTVYTYKSNYIC